MIILVRHGEATHHTQNLTGGWTDSDLTAKGRAQLKALGEKLAKDLTPALAEKLNLRIMASDLKRAAESARIIAAALGCAEKVETHKFLREKNNGDAAGLTEDAAKKIYRRPATEQELDHRNYPGGETRREFYNRSVEGMLKNADWEKENIIVVAHKGTVQNLIFAWLGLDMDKVRDLGLSVDVQPASITVLGVNKWHEHTVFRLNDTSHLSEGGGFGVLNFKYAKN